jgi:hypothetical protein
MRKRITKMCRFDEFHRKNEERIDEFHPENEEKNYKDV